MIPFCCGRTSCPPCAQGWACRGGNECLLIGTTQYRSTGSDGNDYTAALLPCGNVGFGIWQHPGGKYLVSVLEGDQVRVAGSAKQGSFELAKLNAEAFYFDQAAGWLVLDRMGPPGKHHGDKTHGWIVQGGAS